MKYIRKETPKMFIKTQLFAEGEKPVSKDAEIIGPTGPEGCTDKWKEAYDALLVKFNERDAELVAVKQELQEANAQLRNAPIKTEPEDDDDFTDFDDFTL